ncbi:MAG: LysR family transcriptional regulator [Rhodobacteraceae bacterium]|jgi:LysR family transcriptional regulator, nitrogen assimilation regulatory protein|nr:LysR family transcriptional regulator [Paracoccaceae bacterium]
MDLRDFQYFISIAETGSFSKAAMAHTIAQSALSRRIRDLEQDLGVALFYRNGRGVVVTEAGETFLARARSILSDVAQIRQDLNATQTTLQGVVTLGVPPSVGLVLLAPLLSQIRSDYPGIQMRVLEGFSGYVAEWLASGRVDLAVLYKVRAGTFPDAEHLLFEDMHLISGREAQSLGQGSTVTLRQLQGEDMALPGAPHGLRILVDEACSRAQVSLSVAMELETLPTIRGLVSAGTVRTILPVTAVQAELQTGELTAQKIVEPVISRELILVHAPQRANAPATRAVVQLIRDHIERLLESGAWLGRV